MDGLALEDVAAQEMSAVNPDRFMALRYTQHAYREGVGLLASVQKSQPTAHPVLHFLAARQTPG